jgi:anaerobic sulfite reductase subunit B
VPADAAPVAEVASAPAGSWHGAPLVPRPYRVVGRRRETDDVVTLSLAPDNGAMPSFRAGQFNMITAFGVGESAISISSAPGSAGPLDHTVRAVGPVTESLCGAEVGSVLGVRGPFGTDWGIDRLSGGDVVVIAGGIGLAPLRGVVRALIARASRRAREGNRLFVIAGAREPSQIVFRTELDDWARAGAEVAVTVDVSAPGWPGHVGLVTSLLGSAGFDPSRASALVCGPEIMMRLTCRTLVQAGVEPGRIRVSLERNMQCGVAWCGHCQLGPFLLCRDGPVLDYAGVVAHLLSERER